MNRSFGFAIALVAILGMTAPAHAKAEKYVIDPEHFSIAMSVRHMGYFDLIGLFTEGAGSFVFDETKPEVSDIRVTIRTASFESGHKKRDEHVRNADFLNAKEFPEMVFVGKSTEKTGDRTGRIHGALTLRGITKPLTLDVVWVKSAEYPIGGGLFGGKPYVTGINARGTLKRSDFGMTYAVDNGLVGDEITLILGFEARRQSN